MGAVTQREVRVALAGEVEALRVGEHALVLVGVLDGGQEPGGEMGDPVVRRRRVQLGGIQQIRDDVVARDPALALDKGTQVPPERLQGCPGDGGLADLLHFDLPPAEVRAVLGGTPSSSQTTSAGRGRRRTVWKSAGYPLRASSSTIVSMWDRRRRGSACWS
jgi:hypothetical protein